MTAQKILIVGGGNAGLQVADTLRRGGYSGAIDMFCAEQYLPYQRPPLSKKYLEGALVQERLLLRPASFYETKNITLHMGVTVEKIDRAAKSVMASDGRVCPYDTLVLSTGARVRPLPGTDSNLGLLYVRGIDDVAALRMRLGNTPKRIVLVGGGFIGLETAATLKTLGNDVTVVEAMPNVMPGLVAPELAAYIRDQHTAHGVTILENTPVQAVTGGVGAYIIALANGKQIAADVVIVGIGVLPNVEIAQAAGLACERGILVDAYGRTNDPDIYAAGDCANGMHMRFGAHTRLESVQNAVDQATVVGKSILGEDAPHAALPWFWSDQYGMKLQMAGLSRGYDDYGLRGNMADGKFSICYFKDGQLIAVDSLNAVSDHMAARRLLAASQHVSKEQCLNAALPLKDLIA